MDQQHHCYWYCYYDISPDIFGDSVGGIAIAAGNVDFDVGISFGIADIVAILLALTVVLMWCYYVEIVHYSINIVAPDHAADNVNTEIIDTHVFLLFALMVFLMIVSSNIALGYGGLVPNFI